MTTDARATVAVVPMLAEHADQVLAIYQLGIDEGEATFETTARPGGTSTPPTWQITGSSRSTRPRPARRPRSSDGSPPSPCQSAASTPG
jgi:hypothetical protein